MTQPDLFADVPPAAPPLNPPEDAELVFVAADLVTIDDA